MSATSKPTILVQLDTDPQPSVFDGVVAVDSGVDHLFRHGGVTPEIVRDLVHGALFTRGGADLARTAIFIGGSDVAKGEALLRAVSETFFGPFRVSVLLDSNGANTTAAAAVLAAIEGAGGSVDGLRAAVLGGTGPVGQRVARLLAGLGAEVAIGSRSASRARDAAAAIAEATGKAVSGFSTDQLANGIAGAAIIVAAGAAGVNLLPESARAGQADLRVLIDLNAVPPAGIEGVESSDRDADRDGVRCWGALGVGRTKMKIHKAAIKSLFTGNDRVLDAEDVFALGLELN